MFESKKKTITKNVDYISWDVWFCVCNIEDI